MFKISPCCDVCNRELKTHLQVTPFGPVQIIETHKTKIFDTSKVFRHLCEGCADRIDKALLKAREDLGVGVANACPICGCTDKKKIVKCDTSTGMYRIRHKCPGLSIVGDHLYGSELLATQAWNSLISRDVYDQVKFNEEFKISLEMR